MCFNLDFIDLYHEFIHLVIHYLIYLVLPKFPLQVVADLIHENSLKSGKTIVHCMCGVSRSVSLCIAYLMTYKPSLKKIGQNMDLYEALDYIKARRPIARFKIVAVEIQQGPERKNKLK